MFAYCGNNPIRYSDHTGRSWIEDFWDSLRNKIEEKKEESKEKTGTKTVGLNLAGAFGPAAFGSIGIATDKRGNVGFVISGGGGAGFPSGGLAIFDTYTNAPTIEKLNGLNAQLGGAVNVACISGGAELVLFSDSDTGRGYQGVTFLLGLSPIPIGIEMHGEVGTSKVFAVNIYDIGLYLIDWVCPE
jgi:hypothetical protein